MARSVVKKKGSHSKKNGFNSLLIKRRRLEECIQSLDLASLRTLGIERGGFLNSDIRRRAWRCLFHLDANNIASNISHITKNNLIAELPEQLVKQIELDVQRSFSQFKIGASSKELKALLQTLIISVFEKHSWLQYYQGFHDIASVILLTDATSLNGEYLELVSLFWLRDFMEPSFDASMKYLNSVSTLISKADYHLYQRFERIDGFQPIFALSWIITWFSHDVGNPRIVQRLFDAFLSTHPTFPIYVAACLIIKYQPPPTLGSTPELSTDDEIDISLLHRHYQSLPDKLTISDWDNIILAAFRLFQVMPPSSSLSVCYRGAAANEFERAVIGQKPQTPLNKITAQKGFQTAVSRHKVTKSRLELIGPRAFAVSFTIAIFAISWALWERSLHVS